MTVYLPLALKMIAVAFVVVLATMVAERTRPAFAALIATLPLSVGAAYVLMAFEHDADFVSAAALKSVSGASSTVVFISVYAHGVLRFRPAAALTLAFAAWVPTAWMVHQTDWSATSATLFSALVFAIAYIWTFSLRSLRSQRAAKRNWFDAPLRAISVAVFVGILSLFSTPLGPSGVGTLANFPIIMSSVGLILHIRLGPEGAAGMLANSVAGMVGVCLGLMAVHQTARHSGIGPSLALGLAICVIWNVFLFTLGRRATHR